MRRSQSQSQSDTRQRNMSSTTGLCSQRPCIFSRNLGEMIFFRMLFFFFFFQSWELCFSGFFCLILKRPFPGSFVFGIILGGGTYSTSVLWQKCVEKKITISNKQQNIALGSAKTQKTPEMSELKVEHIILSTIVSKKHILSTLGGPWAVFFFVPNQVPWTGKITFTLVSCDISELRWPLELCFGHKQCLLNTFLRFKRNFEIWIFLRTPAHTPPLALISSYCHYSIDCV